jgi:hypothetical protein
MVELGSTTPALKPIVDLIDAKRPLLSGCRLGASAAKDESEDEAIDRDMGCLII